jgi:hypothetical protein
MEVEQLVCKDHGSSSKSNGFHSAVEEEELVSCQDERKQEQQASNGLNQQQQGDQEMANQVELESVVPLVNHHQQQHRHQEQQGRLFEEGEEEVLLHSRPGSSGGYMDFVFRVAAWQLFGVQLPGTGLMATKQLRNADFQELLLQDEEGNTLLRFASAYGFRNIQSLMRKIKGGKCEYDYVEVMACPGGCLNGAGQIPPAKGRTAVQLLEELEMKYYVSLENGTQQGGQLQESEGRGIVSLSRDGQQGNIGSRGQTQQQLQQQQMLHMQEQQQEQLQPQQQQHQQPQQQQQLQLKEQQQLKQVHVQPGVVKVLESRVAKELQSRPGRGDLESVGGDRVGAVARGLYGSWVGGGPGSDAAKGLLHTQYHHREKTVASAISDW